MLNDIYDYASALYDKVKANKEEILRDMDNGNITAATIVTTYNMMVRHPDPIAFGILEMSFEEWLKGKADQNG